MFSPIVSVPETLGDQLPGQRGTIFGRPVLQLPLTTSGGDSNLVDLWLGDWREFAILEGGGFEVRSSEHVEFDALMRFAFNKEAFYGDYATWGDGLREHVVEQVQDTYLRNKSSYRTDMFGMHS